MPQMAWLYCCVVCTAVLSQSHMNIWSWNQQQSEKFEQWNRNTDRQLEIGDLTEREREREREGAVQYISVFHVIQSCWNICKQTIAHLWQTSTSVEILKMVILGEWPNCFLCLIFVWPAIHDFRHINQCLPQANWLVTD